MLLMVKDNFYLASFIIKACLRMVILMAKVKYCTLLVIFIKVNLNKEYHMVKEYISSQMEASFTE